MVRLDSLVHTPVELPTAGNATQRSRKHRARKRKNTVPEDRRMIAWDGEGIKPDGANAPQNYVLFGCSARPHEPMVTTRPDQTLQFRELADYMLETAAMFPGAFHVGYYFKYDQNMIIRTLHWHHKRALYDTGTVKVQYGKVTYKLSWVPGKKTEIHRFGQGDPAYIKIEDMAAFYASSFVAAYRSTFPDADSDPTWAKVIEGKANRSNTKWEDMPAIREYWYYEILAVERLAEGFKRMLWDNGFYLLQWYGPGAFANYLRRTENLVVHEWGGKEENLPNDAVHTAIKSAYYGGHFEQYLAGQIEGPIYQYDINSAYPAAFCHLPSMREGGFWQRLKILDIDADAVNPSSPLTVYYVSFARRVKPGESRRLAYEPMPLPFRDERGNVSYGAYHSGWYWAPEVTAMLTSKRWGGQRISITDAWRWVAADDDRPWARVIESMYATRLELKVAGNPAQMVYKLGPNSLYGKMAQRVGFNVETKEPPKAHTLCIAGFLTSWCRGMILRIMDTMDTEQIIAVETDGIYSTAPPEQVQDRWSGFVFGKMLGEWGLETYDEIVYIQNGVYICRTGDKWTTKTRGINKALLPPDKVLAYVKTCKADDEWASLLIDGGEDFLTLGTAINRCLQPDGTFIAAKANRLHCVWYPSVKIVDAAGSARSKRTHLRRDCPACQAGKTLADGAHRLHIHQRFTPGNKRVSAPYRLPWETTEAEQWRDSIGHDDRSRV